MRTRFWSPRVRYQAVFWICCRGHQDSSRPKRITAFGWVDHQECAHQSGAAVLVVIAARDSSSLGAWEEFLGVERTWGGVLLI
jgi:hypothetical protein